MIVERLSPFYERGARGSFYFGCKGTAFSAISRKFMVEFALSCNLSGEIFV